MAEWAVDDAEAGGRLDAVVASRLGWSRGQAQARIATGRVMVDGRPAAKSDRVVAGTRVVVAEAPAPDPVPAPEGVPVRYRDAHLAVVAKPPGLVVHPGAGVRSGTLVHALEAMGIPLAPAEDPERPGIVHRLDRGTSGLLVVACDAEALEGLAEQLRRREVRRRYWVLVDGQPDPPSATVEAPLGRDPRQRSRYAVDPGGRPAVTHYDVVESLGEAARLDVRLETGRTHQVRVHLSTIGHPVCGDRTYGADPARADALGLGRPALHAAGLGFTHPVTGEWLAFEEPLPDDLESALGVLRDRAGTQE
ncbi:RluA family pseudouridine synthase [Egibacter rhizosphaerae]|uniref:Pseudouridine synthase n=1 Tax=Egibacter rhizosphaerae TaxID=1670831 RepID=A0A411YKT4_9ACTN|nr:RluA family pseudouridine synthase [Egibacter rhizosphaerae]